MDCVELKRAEARFGNGDGVYTLAEQTNALNSYYNLFNGPYTFNDLGRQARLGFELEASKRIGGGVGVLAAPAP